jgi:hypothetical protein
MPRNSLALLISIGIALCVYSCKDIQENPSSSFDLIQSKIITPSCAMSGCHASSGDATFSQHGLVLEQSVAYKNLINVLPKNANALADTFFLVKPSDPEKSLFLHKLHLYDDHHAHDYGNPMPLGLKKLTVGQVEFIEQWITAGAPATGTVADASLLNDATEQSENFVPLAAPAAGKGFQINIPKFQVVPNFEREFFVYKKLGNTSDIFVNRFEIKMRLNSHHIVLYDFNSSIPPSFFPQPNVIRDIRNPDGTLLYFNMIPMAYHVFVVGGQSPYVNYEFPPGVAIRFPANAGLDFNSHYVNKEPTPIDGEVNVNFYTADAAAVQKEAKTLNMSNTSIDLAPGERTTLSKTFTMSSSVSVLALTSHTHQLGEKFVIKIAGGSRNGEIVYTNEDWHHPQFISYNPPIVLQPGEGLISEITYNNIKTVQVRFGLTSEDEMGIIFGYYTNN